MMQDRYMAYCKVEATLGISSTSIYKLLYEHLAVKKIYSRWIPHNLPKFEKDSRVDWCKQLLKKCSDAWKKMLSKLK